jgi:hypothetical protein
VVSSWRFNFKIVDLIIVGEPSFVFGSWGFLRSWEPAGTPAVRKFNFNVIDLILLGGSSFVFGCGELVRSKGAGRGAGGTKP